MESPLLIDEYVMVDCRGTWPQARFPFLNSPSTI